MKTCYLYFYDGHLSVSPTTISLAQAMGKIFDKVVVFCKNTAFDRYTFKEKNVEAYYMNDHFLFNRKIGRTRFFIGVLRYMFKKGANFTTWNSLNPQGFSYGNINNGLSYASTYSQDAPFVNAYAMTSAEEDRASTFEYMMAGSKASCLNYGTPVWKKSTVIKNMIETVYNTANPNTTEYWERYL